MRTTTRPRACRTSAWCCCWWPPMGMETPPTQPPSFGTGWGRPQSRPPMKTCCRRVRSSGRRRWQALLQRGTASCAGAACSCCTRCWHARQAAVVGRRLDAAAAGISPLLIGPSTCHPPRAAGRVFRRVWAGQPAVRALLRHGQKGVGGHASAGRRRGRSPRRGRRRQVRLGWAGLGLWRCCSGQGGGRCPGQLVRCTVGGRSKGASNQDSCHTDLLPHRPTTAPLTHRDIDDDFDGWCAGLFTALDASDLVVQGKVRRRWHADGRWGGRG